MRSIVTLTGFMLLSGTFVFAATEKTLPDARELARLETRAAQAGPENRLFVYAELIRVSTNLAIAQLQAGSAEQAYATLASVQAYASKVDLQDAKGGSKKLKHAEILLGQAAFRLHNLLMSAPLEDRPFLEKALAQVNKVQSALLLRVFEH